MRILVLSLAMLLAACAGTDRAETPTPAAPGSTPTFDPFQFTPDASGDPLDNLPTADQLCALLGSADWAQLGLTTAGQPTVDSDGAGGAYCTYSDSSGATGGLELDVFVDENAQYAHETYQTMADEGLGDGQTVTLPGADEAIVNPNVDGDYGSLVARSGKVSFSLSLPAGDQAQTQLLALAAIVLTRAQAYR